MRTKNDIVLQRPVIVAVVLLVFFVGYKLSFSHSVKSCIKSVLHISNEVNTGIVKDKRIYLYEDIARYFNEKVVGRKALIAYPFLEFDFPLFVPRHDSFISYHTPVYNLFFSLQGSSEFRYILKNDLNYSLDRIFEGRTNNAKVYYDRWDEIWRNLNEGIISRWKERYNLTHVIREKDLPLNFPVVYQNSFYVVYEIK